MNILLVKPPQKTNEVQPPLGLGYLASSVKNLADVEILDCIKLGLDTNSCFEKIKNTEFDIIGFQCYTVDFNTVKELSKLVKEVFPDKIQLVGGPQPSLDPVNTIKSISSMDFAFVSEAELSLPLFVKAVINNSLEKEKANIPSLVYRENNAFKINPFKRPENLDDFNPSWELYGLEDYPLAPHGAFCKQSPTAPLIISRGCPFQCTYCGGPLISGRQVRYHGVDFVLKTIKLLHNKYGIKELHIEDDNFTLNREFLKEFCTRLIELDLGITWQCPNGMRLDTLDDELIKLMKRSGLYSISLGIESGSDRVLKLMKKSLTTKIVRERMELINRNRLDMIGFFIVGFPGETVEDINKTIKFACELPLKRATFSAFKPFPGTPIYDELVEKGEIEKLDLSKFSLDRVVWSPKGISMKKLNSLRRKAFLKFYLRPKIMFKMLGEIRSFENFKFILRRMYRWMK